MATIERLAKRLDDLDQNHGYFTIEDMVSVYWQPVPGESLDETLHRKYPFKKFHPEFLEYCLKEQSRKDQSE